MSESTPPCTSTEAADQPEKADGASLAKKQPAFVYRENPARALYIDDPIGDQLYKRIIREYHKLRAESLDPITVYISSPGGNLRYFEWLRDLFFTEGHNGERPVIVMVGKGMVASAAARLLAAGDYSMCYPSSLIHCHGSRIPTVDDLTKEAAEEIGRDLRTSNRSTAIEFVDNILCNLAFLFDSNRTEIDTMVKEDQLSSVVAFATLVADNLSPNGARMMEDVFEDLNENDKLQAFLTEQTRREALGKARKEGKPAHDLLLLKSIAEFVFTDAQGDNYETEEALLEVERLYRARLVYFEDFMTNLSQHSDILATHLLGQDEFTKWDAMEAGKEKSAFEAEVSFRLFFPFWQLASSIAHRLVVGENPLIGMDAYWLGIVNEVVGSDYPCLRQVLEAGAVNAAPSSTPAIT